MLKESHTVWVVKFMCNDTAGDEHRTERTRYADGIHAAFELAEEHMETQGATFAPMAGSYLLDSDDKRVSISERDVYRHV